MRISDVSRSPRWLAFALFVAACSSDQGIPSDEPAGELDQGEAQATGSDESEALPQLGATDPATQTAPKTCASGAGTLRSGRASISIGGVNRSYIVHVPPSYRGDKAVPLLVDLHPLFMNASFEQGNSGYQAIANREGFIVVYPDGVRAGLGTGWNIGPCCTKGNDEEFILKLVEKIKGSACIDEKRVYAAGYSMGGGMSHYLACNAADVFAATSPAAFDLLVESEMPCKPARPISVIIFRGTADAIVPFRGGASTPPNGGGGTIHFEGAEGTFKRWAQINGCTGGPTSGTAGCRTYGDCKGGVEVTLCVAQGGGHVTGDATFAWSRLSKYAIP